MNAPERVETIVLPDGVKKYACIACAVSFLASWLLELVSFRLTEEKDTKINNCNTYIIEREDHTLGNLLRVYATSSAFVRGVEPEMLCSWCRELLNDSDTLFAGYRVPHPLSNCIHIKVQARSETAPREVLQRTVRSREQEIKSLKQSFKVS